MSNKSNTATANVIFDPAIHATDNEGNPVMRKDGTFALKRGRKAGSTVTPALAASTLTPLPAPTWRVSWRPVTSTP